MSLTDNYYVRLNKLVKDKRSSLSCRSVSDEEEKFDKIRCHFVLWTTGGGRTEKLLPRPTKLFRLPTVTKEKKMSKKARAF
jgi:hypothetical protein